MRQAAASADGGSPATVGAVGIETIAPLLQWLRMRKGPSKGKQEAIGGTGPSGSSEPARKLPPQLPLGLIVRVGGEVHQLHILL